MSSLSGLVGRGVVKRTQERFRFDDLLLKGLFPDFTLGPSAAGIPRSYP